MRRRLAAGPPFNGVSMHLSAALATALPWQASSLSTFSTVGVVAQLIRRGR